MAIAKKRGDNYVTILEHVRMRHPCGNATSYLRAPVYASMMFRSEKNNRGIYHCGRACYCRMRPLRIG